MIPSINKLEVPIESYIQRTGIMPRQKTKEELLDRIENSKRRMRRCRIRLTQSQTSSKEKRRTTTRKTRASLRCRLENTSPKPLRESAQVSRISLRNSPQREIRKYQVQAKWCRRGDLNPHDG